jgi:hypothetical protein
MPRLENCCFTRDWPLPVAGGSHALDLGGVKRRTFLGLAGATGGGALLGYGHWVEPAALTFTRHTLRLSGTGAVDAEVPDGDPIRVVQLSDLHVKSLESIHETLAREVDALEPHLLAFTGDTVDQRENVPLVGELLSLFRTQAPKLAVMGNWEYQGGVGADALERELAQWNGALLLNRSEELAMAGRKLVVTGLDDWLRGSPDLAKATRQLPDASLERGHHIVMAHCPAQRDELVGRASDRASPPWILSGHTHGGQVGLPGLRVTPYGSGDYVRGWYRDGAPSLYVSRGIGTSVVPLRIGSRPEVAVFDVHLS